MDASEIAKQLNDKKKTIDDRYGKWVEKINEYLKAINDAQINYSKNSNQFINKKIAIYRRKIDELQKYAEEWLQEQLKSVESWANGEISKTNSQIEEKTKTENKTIETFKNNS